MRGIAVGTNARQPSLSEVPTSAEAGLPAFQLQGWNALFAPKGTPEAIMAKLNAALRTGVVNAGYLKRLDELGAVRPTDEEMTPDYVRQFIPREVEKFRQMLTEKK